MSRFRFFVEMTKAGAKTLFSNKLLTVSLLLTAAFCVSAGALLPPPSKVTAMIGIVMESEQLRPAAKLLLANKDFPALTFSSEEELRKALVTGTVQAGYILSDSAPAIRSMALENNIYQPLLDKQVTAACFSVTGKTRTQALLKVPVQETEKFSDLWDEIGAQITPPKAEIITESGVEADITKLLKMPPQTPLYRLSLSLLYCLLPALSMISSSCACASDTEGLALLGRQRGMFPTGFAFGLGRTCFFFILNTVALAFVTWSSEFEFPFFVSNLISAFLLSLVCAACYAVGNRLSKASFFVVTCCLIWVPASVLWGGGLIAPERLPPTLQMFRYISPASLIRW